jgi:hypothetical protein
VRALWRLELLAYWRQRGKPDLGDWWPVIRLAGIVLWIEFVVALYIMGGLRPLSALG